MPMLIGTRYALRDWHAKPIGTRTVQHGVLRVPSGRPVFLIELELKNHTEEST
jgi:hypothetical protein